jgi:hypothetical protein
MYPDVPMAFHEWLDERGGFRLSRTREPMPAEDPRPWRVSLCGMGLGADERGDIDGWGVLLCLGHAGRPAVSSAGVIQQDLGRDVLTRLGHGPGSDAPWVRAQHSAGRRASRGSARRGAARVTRTPRGEHHPYLPGDAPALACGADIAELVLFPEMRFTTALRPEIRTHRPCLEPCPAGWSPGANALLNSATGTGGSRVREVLSTLAA